MSSINPIYAHNSSTVTTFHFSNFSGPIHSAAYLLVCSTISSNRVGVKKRKKISFADPGIGTFGPGVFLKPSTDIGVSCSVHVIFSAL